MANANTLEPQNAATEMDILQASTFDAHIASLNNPPQWLLNMKRESWERFQSLPMPGRKDENWRFSNVRKLSLEGRSFFQQASPEDAREAEARSDAVAERAGQAVFVDGHLVKAPELDPDLTAQGVLWLPLEQAFTEAEGLLRERFGKQRSNLGSEKFYALHAAYAQSGMFLYVPEGVCIDKPFAAWHWTAQDGAAIFPHTLVILEDNAQAAAIDFFESLRPETSALSCGCCDVIAGKGAQLRHSAVQSFNLNTLAFQLDTIEAGKDAGAKSVIVNIGSGQLRNERTSRIKGEGANVEMYSLSVPDGSQEIDQRTLQVHEAPEARSDLLYKNALMDDARSIFSGLIIVEEGAQQTDAYQTNNNLLLSETAGADSLPGLEIAANDVKCSHGATSGQLDKSNLFYFLARGIPQRKAEELLVFGFFEEIVQKFDNEELAERVRALVQGKFHN